MIICFTASVVTPIKKREEMSYYLFIYLFFHLLQLLQIQGCKPVL
jgi:hypothetical protein